MYKHEHCLTPISKPLPPPPHTKVRVKCFTCKKFPVCNIRADYLRTALLIENIVGRPCENLELHHIHPCFKGISIPFAIEYLPQTIVTKMGKEGIFFALKSEDIDNYNFIYCIDGRKLLFKAEYIDSVTSFGANISDEELFNLLPIDGITYPAKTTTIDMTFYHYLPVGMSVSKNSIDQAREMINSIDEGEFNITLSFAIKGIFGNFNKEERYPTEEEIKDNPDLILNGITAGKLIVPIIKKNGKLSLNKEIIFKISPTTDTEMWDSTFRTQNLNFSMEDSQKIFDYINTITENGYFKISEGKDIYCKNVVSEISDADKEDINKSLLKIREKLINNKQKTAINTTAFSAELKCHFYEWEKGLTEEEGLKRVMLKYPEGIQIDDNEYYHLETIHLEPGKVPCYHPLNGTPVFMPMPYPVYIPPKCECECDKKRIPTRDELNEY